MAVYRYTQNQGNLKKFLEHVQSTGIPSKVTQQYLAQCGYKASNDRNIIGILKSIDLIDSTGVPNSNWKAYRDKSKAPNILAGLIRAAYPDLFSTFPDAQDKDEEALRNFFSANTDIGQKALGLTVATFKTLAEMSSFSKKIASSPKKAAEESQVPQIQTAHTSTRGMTLNINIELAIPPTDNPDVYDAFFKSMKKHLLGDE